MIRDLLRKWVPPWLSDRPSKGLTVGFRVLYAGALIADAVIEQADQALSAKLPGIGTPTALDTIGQDRGIFRGRADDDLSYARKLREWIDRWSSAGQAYALAREVQDYLGPIPDGGGELYTVRVFNRSGAVVSRDAAGEVTTLKPGEAAWTWNWDGLSHPERAGWWSDLWVVVTPMPWATIPEWAESTTAWGQDAPQPQVAVLREIAASWKAGHSYVRAVIFAPSEHEGVPVLDPATIATSGQPNGWWGAWSRDVAGVRVPARPDWMRFWEAPLDA